MTREHRYVAFTAFLFVEERNCYISFSFSVICSSQSCVNLFLVLTDCGATVNVSDLIAQRTTPYQEYERHVSVGMISVLPGHNPN